MHQTAAVVRSLSFYSFVLVIGFVVSMMPLLVSAQTADDYGTGAGSRVDIPSYCPKLTKTTQFGSSDPYVSRGTRGGNVTELQKFLSGYFDIPADEIVSGYFGRVTEGYVIQFQKDRGLPALGIAGQLTRVAIAENCSGNSTGNQSPAVTSTTDAVNRRGLNGQSFDYMCPASNSYGTIWGDLVYTDDSSVCGAAVHAGVITTAGGKVTITIKPGQSDYAGSTKNGIATRTWGSWHGSFTVLGATTNPTNGITVTAPNGGEQWEMGILNTVTWTPYSYNPDVNPSKDVTAYLETKNADGSFTTLGKVQESGKASIHWITGELDSATIGGKYAPVGTYYIRVVNNLTGATDRSDRPFSILPKPINIKVNGSENTYDLSDVNKPITVSWTTGAGISTCQLGGMKNVSFSTIQPNSGSVSGLIEYQSLEGGGISYGVRLQCVSSLSGTPKQVSADAKFLVSSLPTTASLQVLNPNGGEKIQLGQQYAIRWNQKGLRSAAIALYRNDQWMMWINQNVTTNEKDVGLYVWDVGSIDYQERSVSTLGSIFKIYITGQKSDGTGYVDDKSDSTFSFVAASTSSQFPIATDKSSYTLGESVTVVNWALRSGIKTNDWVALVPAGKKYTAQSWNSNADKVSWVFVGNRSTESSLVIPSPKTVGTYEAVYYPNNGFTEAARSQPFTVVAKPVTPVIAFTASTSSVQEGKSITWQWEAKNAESCTMKYGDSAVGSVELKRSETFTPMVTMTYTLVCINGNLSATKSLTITVVNTTSPTMGRSEIYVGDGSIITPSISEQEARNTCEKNANANPTRAIRCLWNGVEYYKRAATTVSQMPSCSITSDKSSYSIGETAKFSWTSTYATSIAWVPDTSGKDNLVMTGAIGSIGSQSVVINVSGNPFVTIKVTNAAGQTATCTKSVSVTSPTPTPSQGAAAVSSWTKQNFSSTGSTSCTGDRYVGYSAKYSAWIGAIQCGSNMKYKLYMSQTQTGTYLQIADTAGHGQDHCELVNSTFSIPNEDSIQSGGCVDCSVGALIDVQNEQVFSRSKFGEQFKKVTSSYWGDLTTSYYMCGAPIGSALASAPQTPAPTPVAPSCVLKASKTSVQVGETFKLTWTTANASSAKWASDQSSVGLTGSKDVTASAEGSVQVVLLVAGAASSAECSVSYTVTARKPGKATLTPGTYYQQSVSPNDNLTISWSYTGVPTAKDWIVIVPNGTKLTANNYANYTWFYTGGSLKGSQTVKVPQGYGSYDIVYLDNDGYVEVGRSAGALEVYDASQIYIQTGQVSQSFAAAIMGVAMLPIDIAVDGISDFLLMAGWY